MGVASYSGASSVIKPGVVTTATRPSSPFVGQMIYDTTLSQTLVWNGSAWAIDSGGLTYITTLSMASHTVNFEGCFTSAYTDYRAIFNYTVASANAVYLRYLVGSTAQTTTIFSLSTGNQQSVPNTFSGSARSDQYALWATGYPTYPTVVTCDFLSPQVAAYTNYMYSFVTGLSATDFFAGDGYGRNAATTQIDGFQLYTGSPAITGTMTLYGYRKA